MRDYLPFILMILVFGSFLIWFWLWSERLNELHRIEKLVTTPGPLKTCYMCYGRGSRRTGAMVHSTNTCFTCDGTGKIVSRLPKPPLPNGPWCPKCGEVARHVAGPLAWCNNLHEWDTALVN